MPAALVIFDFDEFAHDIDSQVREIIGSAGARLVVVPGDTVREWYLGSAEVSLTLLREREAMIATAVASVPRATYAVSFDDAGINEAVYRIASHLLGE